MRWFINVIGFSDSTEFVGCAEEGENESVTISTSGHWQIWPKNQISLGFALSAVARGAWQEVPGPRGKTNVGLIEVRR